jgi:Lipoate synthase
VLIPDFLGSAEALETVLRASPEVLNHNTETVARLYRRVRPDAIYVRSLELLSRAAAFRDGSAPAMRVKSGLMVGLGEELDEVLDTMRDLRAAGTDTLTVGQYLQPHARRLPVERWWTPESSRGCATRGGDGVRRRGGGPLVRSSYHARAALGAAGGGDAAAPR